MVLVSSDNQSSTIPFCISNVVIILHIGIVENLNVLLFKVAMMAWIAAKFQYFSANDKNYASLEIFIISRVIFIRLPLGNESIVFNENFQSRIFTWFMCFQVPWVQRSAFCKFVCAYLCMWLCMKYSVLYISKTKKTPNFMYSTR